MSLGENIRIARKRNGLTQEELAERLGVSFKAVSGWENDKYQPTVENLEQMSLLLNVGTDKLCGGEFWKYDTKMFDESHVSAFLKSRFADGNWPQSTYALRLAKETHADVYRDNEGLIPYILHPMTLACQAFAMGIADDDLVAALLLHDVIEDSKNGLKVDDLNVNDPVKDIVRLVTKNKGSNFTEEAYYRVISGNPKACLVKCMDRCNNISTMSIKFSRKKMAEYVRETEEYIMPLLDTVKNTPGYNNTAWLLGYQMKSQLLTYKAFL